MKKKNNTENKLDPMVKFVVEQFEYYEREHRDLFEKKKKLIDYWNNKPPARDEDWQNAVVVPITVEAEQTITPRLFNALFPNTAPIEVQVEGHADRGHANIIKSTIQHFFRVANVQGHAYSAIAQTVLLGTGYIEMGMWLARLGNRPDGTVYLAESRPKAEFIDFFEMYPHPSKKELDDGLPIIRRQEIDAETLKRYADITPIKNLKEALESDFPKEAGVKPSGTINRRYEILHYWGTWDKEYEQNIDNKTVKVKKAVPHWIIVVNRKVLIRGDVNPYNHQLPPYCRLKMFPDQKPSWYGIGIGDIGAPTQERLNKMVNQRLDNVDLVLQKQCAYNANDPYINKKKLSVAKPGQKHAVADVNNSIKWIDTPDVTSSSFKEEEIAKADFRQSTGASAPIVPTGEQHRTAMGISMLQSAAGVRFLPVLRVMEQDLITRGAMFFLTNLQQFMSQPEWIQLTSDDGKKVPWLVTPENIMRKADFIPTGVSEAQNREMEVSQLLRFKEITQDDPTVNRQEINRRIASLMGFKDIDKLLTDITRPEGGGALSAQKQLLIQQRLQEGATPAQIKQEILGPPPQPGVE